MSNLVLYVNPNDRGKAEKMMAAGGANSRAVQVKFKRGNQTQSYDIDNLEDIRVGDLVAEKIFWIGHGRAGALSAKDGTTTENTKITKDGTFITSKSIRELLNKLNTQVFTIQGCDVAKGNGSEKFARKLAENTNSLAIINMSSNPTMFAPSGNPAQNVTYWNAIMQDVHIFYKREHEYFVKSTQSAMTTFGGEPIATICQNGGYTKNQKDQLKVSDS
ncbi:MAG: hypothetical protein GQ564_08540 [Bacteroidales bacterium]|nr:hypothetical protein [Bacteroidales bacterium]